jgi:hypothetical protein
MKKFTAALFLAATSFAAGAQAIKYEPAVVSLSGTLLSSEGESPSGKAIAFPALQLAKPITVQGDADTPTERGVALMHMVLGDPKMMAAFKSLKGKPVVVTGTLFHADNGNHQTAVLVTPTAITAK